MPITFRLAILLLLGLFSLNSHFAMADKPKAQTNQQLTDVQKEIAQQKLAISNVSKKRQKLENQLKQDDLAIARVAKNIETTTSKLKKAQIKLSELAKEKTSLTQKKRQQENVLAQQLRAAYSNGHHDYLKLLLNQEQTNEIQRTLTYYQYLNSARIKEIESFQQTLVALQGVTIAHIDKKQELAELKNTQLSQKLSFKASKKERSKTIVALNKDLLTNKQKLAKLEAEENNLVLALEKLAAVARAELTLNGLKKLRHKLRWPVKGRMTHSFGSQKQGYLKWKGVLLSAPIGRQVKSIHNGTVLFSDWLKGYGLVTVIDHGNGYMSLYGHNQTLLKDVGDRVETGEPIALVGQSGGQQRSGLYFEIRHKGKAVNPKLWCK